jgi:periplasmic divalent cation tolerance protein
MMNSTDKIVVLVTTDGEEQAGKIADLLVNQRKAACVNIVPSVNSTFWWQGKIDSEHEYLLLIKSKASLLPKITELIKQVHSYEVPEIIAVPIVGGNDDYLKWIDDEVQE